MLLKKNILGKGTGRVLAELSCCLGWVPETVLEGDRRDEFLSTSSGASLVKENLHPSVKYPTTFSLEL